MSQSYNIFYKSQIFYKKSKNLFQNKTFGYISPLHFDKEKEFDADPLRITNRTICRPYTTINRLRKQISRFSSSRLGTENREIDM